MCFSTDGQAGEYAPLSSMPALRLLHLYPMEGRFSPIRASCIEHSFIPAAQWEYAILTMPSEMTTKWSNPVEVGHSTAAEGQLCMPRVLDQAIRKLSRDAGGEFKVPLWIRSACIWHDDAFEGAYFSGSLLPSVYARASEVYIWTGGGLGMVDAMNWIDKAVAEFKQYDESRDADLRTREPWYTNATRSFPFDKKMNGALKTFFSKSAFYDIELRMLTMAAMAENVHVAFFGETGYVQASHVYMVCEYFINTKPEGMSSELIKIMAQLNAVDQQARALAAALPNTIPAGMILYSGAPARQHNIDQITQTSPTARRIDGFNHTVVKRGYGRKPPVTARNVYHERAHDSSGRFSPSSSEDSIHHFAGVRA